MKSYNLFTIALVLFAATTSAFAEADTFPVGTSPEGLAFGNMAAHYGTGHDMKAMRDAGNAFSYGVEALA